MNKRWFWNVLPALVAIAAFWPALGNGLVWDDVSLATGLLDRVAAEGLLETIGAPLSFSPNYFRPLGMLTLILDQLAVGGVDPVWHHATNLALHALNTFFVTLLAGVLFKGTSAARGGPLTAGLLYGLHPALVESVSFIACRFDLLCTLFMLIGLWADGALRRTWARAVCVGVAFFVAALAKEMAIAFPVVLVLLQLARGETGASLKQRLFARGNVAVWGGTAAAGCAYLGVRYAALGYLLVPDSGYKIPVGWGLPHVLIVAKSYGRYLFVSAWPFGTTTPLPWSELPVPPRDVYAWVSAGAMVALLAGVVLAIWKWPRVAGLLAAALVALLPVVNITPLSLAGGAFVADRFLTFPLTLLVLVATVVIARLLRNRAVLGGLSLAGWCIASVVAIRMDLPHWESDETLWVWGCDVAPRSPVPYSNLALVRCYQDRPQEGLELSDRAIELYPESGTAHNNRGMALVHLDRWEEAEQAFRASLAVRPDAAYTWSNLARVITQFGRLGEAERILLDEVLSVDPDDGVGNVNLALVYERGNRPDLARVHLDRARANMPEGNVEAPWLRTMLERTGAPMAWLKLGEAYVDAGKPEQALATFTEAARLGALRVDVAIGQARALTRLDRMDEAAALLEQAAAASPEDARPHNNLGTIARARGDLDAARKHFAEAVRLAPEWDLARQNLATVTDALSVDER